MMAAMIGPVQLMRGRASMSLRMKPIFAETMAEVALLGGVYGPQSCLRSGMIEWRVACCVNCPVGLLFSPPRGTYRQSPALERVSYAVCSVRAFTEAQGSPRHSA